MTLREFLLKNVPAKEIEEARQRTRNEWVTAVGRLLDQMRNWLMEAGAAELLDVRPLEVERREQSLGAYNAPGLAIHFGDRIVKVEPVARNVLAPEGLSSVSGSPRAGGRVDITNDGYSRYHLYRKLKPDGDQWLVRDERSNIRPLDKELFEAILQDLLA
jgi:hypothetical protein